MNWQISVHMKMGDFQLDVDLEAEAKTIVLVGPNGSGKTTLLQSIVGALQPDSGRIQIDNRVLFHSEIGVNLPPEDRRLGYVPQGLGLFPHLRAVDNVAFGWTAHSRRIPRKERRKLAIHWLDKMDSTLLANRRISELSGGEEQKVALARALAVDPTLLLLDEPLAALDAPNRRSLRTFLVQYFQKHERPTLLVSHDLNDVMAFDAHIVVIEAGRIVQAGSAHDLSSRPATDFVREFFRTDWTVRKPESTPSSPGRA
jgi:molybdate transport system ATP-binding protein